MKKIQIITNQGNYLPKFYKKLYSLVRIYTKTKYNHNNKPNYSLDLQKIVQELKENSIGTEVLLELKNSSKEKREALSKELSTYNSILDRYTKIQVQKTIVELLKSKS